jgi:hypothetical protein
LTLTRKRTGNLKWTTTLLKFQFAPSLVPPDYLRFKAPDGTSITAADREVWYAKIRKHYADNSIPLPVDYKEQAQHQCCLTMPPGFCVHEDGAGAEGINTRLTLGDFFRGMEVLTAVAVENNPLVSQELAESRAAICARCPANVTVPGCAPCVGISNFILKIKGTAETKADHVLKTCAICKCSCQAHVWVRSDLLEKGVTEDHLRQMESMPECWKAQEVRKNQQRTLNL